MTYEKPTMKFVSMQSRDGIAAGNCWSNAASTGHTTWYYDYNGGAIGYLVFHTLNNCSNIVGAVEIHPESMANDPEAIRAAAILTEFLNGKEGKQQFTEHGITDDVTQVS